MDLTHASGGGVGLVCPARNHQQQAGDHLLALSWLLIIFTINNIIKINYNCLFIKII